ncbi:MAG TPA: LutB/LldF family L-lactate oxidation iron-sulfur protein [Symbiobacteriaceae bacterium]|jgi:L-lactate dehydrogenase complex protein LldF
MTTTFHDRVAKALGDEHLKGALRFTTNKLYNGRLGALADMNSQAGQNMALGSFDELKARAREIKEHTLEHLDYYLQTAAANIRAAGGTVHFAKNAGEVVAISEEICRRRGAKLAIKSKSMASEEVHLNHALEEAGVQVVESDLGEYIIQLAGESPAHLVIPAIHKTRQQVAKLFEAVGGQPLTTDTPTLTAFARKVLRKMFMTADVGFTGANFLVANTGTLCIVTNEGNGRLTTSVPPVQIAVVGMEKLVPNLEDVAPLYALLPKSATGQKVSTYFNMITGPRRPGDPDGPEELHVILMDNGRTNILGSKYHETLYCIRCAACLNACPVYRNIGGHAYSPVYSGPIGATIMPLLDGFANWGDLAQASSLCGACTEVCPVGIHLHDHLVQLRADLAMDGKVHWFQRFAIRSWMGVWRRPWSYRLASKMSYWLMRPWVKKLPNGREVCESLPFPISNWTNTRNFPAAARRTFQDRWAELQGGEVK